MINTKTKLPFLFTIKKSTAHSFLPNSKGKKMIVSKEKANLSQILEKIKKTNSPKGTLNIQKSHNSIQYLCASDKGRQYLTSKDIDLIKALAQKKYNQLVEKAAINELSILEYIEKKNENCISQVYDSLSKEMKALITPFEIPTSEYNKQWESVSYPSKPLEEGTKYITTSKGDRVRSKSEFMIAEALFQKKIPYHYEQKMIIVEPYSLNQISFYPDFTILNPRTRKVYIWEHFGMMDNKDYVDNALGKINLFNQNGYFLGQNLIFTFENSNNPIQTKMISNLITYYLT